MTLVASGTDSDAVGTTAVKTLTFSSAVPVDSLLAISCSMNGAASALNSASDGLGNTYTVRSTCTFTSNTITNYVILCDVSAGIPSSTVLTLTWANARNRFAAVWGAFSDSVTATTLDGADAEALGTSTTSATGTSGDPAADRVLSLMGVGTRGLTTTWVPDSPYSTVGFIVTDATSTGRGAGLGYRYVDNPGALSGTGTLSPSEQWTSQISNVAVPVIGPVRPRRDPSRGLVMR